MGAVTVARFGEAYSWKFYATPTNEGSKLDYGNKWTTYVYFVGIMGYLIWNKLRMNVCICGFTVVAGAGVAGMVVDSTGVVAAGAVKGSGGLGYYVYSLRFLKCIST